MITNELDVRTTVPTYTGTTPVLLEVASHLVAKYMTIIGPAHTCSLMLSHMCNMSW